MAAYIAVFVIFVIISFLMWYISVLNKLENAEESIHRAEKELDSALKAKNLIQKKLSGENSANSENSEKAETVRAAENEIKACEKNYREKIEIYNYAFDHFPQSLVTRLSGKKKYNESGLKDVNPE